MNEHSFSLEVVHYMLNCIERGPERGSAITGRSTHNQRIERLWRNSYAGCIFFFFTLSPTRLKILYRAQQILKSALDHLSL